MKKICVFCGSSSGNDPVYEEYARKLASVLNINNQSLVYGGGSVGLMGVIADELLRLGGEVIGVIPEFLADLEVDHKGLTKMITVDSMHERKKIMSELSDAFIAMPGGFGTLEEIAEIITWAQLGLVRKPIGLLNVNGYWDPLVNMLDHMVDVRFLKPENRSMLQIDNDPVSLLASLQNYIPVITKKWLDKDQT
jgi:uncharacterized protein (TIGR00730 family)